MSNSNYIFPSDVGLFSQGASSANKQDEQTLAAAMQDRFSVFDYPDLSEFIIKQQHNFSDLASGFSDQQISCIMDFAILAIKLGANDDDASAACLVEINSFMSRLPGLVVAEGVSMNNIEDEFKQVALKIKAAHSLASTCSA